MLKSLRFVLTEDEKSMVQIIKCIACCVILHDFFIAENDEGNAHFYEEDDCASNIDAGNESNCPANGTSNEDERRNQLTAYFSEMRM